MQSIKGVVELLLRAALVGEELDVVDDQRLDLPEAFPEAFHVVRPERLDHGVHEVLRGEPRDRAPLTVGGEGMGNRGEKMGLPEPDAAVHEERTEVCRGVGHDRRCRLVGHAVTGPHDEILEGVAGRRGLGGARRARRAPCRAPQLHVERPVDDEDDRGGFAARPARRVLQDPEEAPSQPVPEEAARGLERERAVRPACRAQRRDPGLIIFLGQFAAQALLRRAPDGVAHPPPLLRPGTVRRGSCPDATSTAGENSSKPSPHHAWPPCDRHARHTTPPHRRPPRRETTAFDLHPSTCARKQYAGTRGLPVLFRVADCK